MEQTAHMASFNDKWLCSSNINWTLVKVAQVVRHLTKIIQYICATLYHKNWLSWKLTDLLTKTYACLSSCTDLPDGSSYNDVPSYVHSAWLGAKFHIHTCVRSVCRVHLLHAIVYATCIHQSVYSSHTVDLITMTHSWYSFRITWTEELILRVFVIVVILK